MKLLLMKFCYGVALVLIVSLGLSTCNKKNPPTKPDGPVVPDTTSHEFEWQVTYFGEGANSYLKDVAIIDEDNIWAVGEIYETDSLGNIIYPTSNVMHWNGMEVKFNKIFLFLWRIIYFS